MSKNNSDTVIQFLQKEFNKTSVKIDDAILKMQELIAQFNSTVPFDAMDKNQNIKQAFEMFDNIRSDVSKVNTLKDALQVNVSIISHISHTTGDEGALLDRCSLIEDMLYTINKIVDNLMMKYLMLKNTFLSIDFLTQKQNPYFDDVYCHYIIGIPGAIIKI